jgi:hypothetical protein
MKSRWILWNDQVVVAFIELKQYLKLKDQRRRQEGGEWEPIKILIQELTYVPSSNPKVKTLQ